MRTQLVNAVITSSTAVQGRFKYEYGGDWEKFKPGAANASNERGLSVRVGAVLKGETEITWGEPLYMEYVTTRNSPLRKTAPKRLAYLAVKYRARLYCPDVILGVYTPDEFEPAQRAERDVTPARSRADLNNLIPVSLKRISPGAKLTRRRTSVQQRACRMNCLPISPPQPLKLKTLRGLTAATSTQHACWQARLKR